MAELVSVGTVGRGVADWLQDHVRRGGSIVIASSAAGAGKSTLAYALSEAIDPSRDKVHIRGNHEPFDWPASMGPTNSTLLVNEISPHLPVYCWGMCARRLLELAASGFQIITTAHAASPGDLLAALTSPPIGARVGDVVALNVVVFLDSRSPGRPMVSLIARLEWGGGGTQFEATSVDLMRRENLPVWSGYGTRPRRYA